MRTVLAVYGIANTDNAFRRKVIQIADRLGLNADYLLAVMSFETGGTFDPAQPNLAGGSARGLIQFLPSTAQRLDTTMDELVNMSQLEQLDYVEKYYKNFGPIEALEGHYLAVLRGNASLRGNDVVFTKHTDDEKERRRYEKNSGLDLNGDGTVTALEATIPVRNIVAAAKLRPPVVVNMRGQTMPPFDPPGGDAGIVGASLFIGITAWTLHRFQKRSRLL